MTTDIDKRIALEVMGWEEKLSCWLDEDRTVVSSGFYPSIKIADAWLVVERMSELGWDCFKLVTAYPDGFYVDFWKDGDQEYEIDIDGHGGDAAPMAICKTALAAMESK